MVERLTIKPSEIIETPDNIIFLAGPIQGAPDWQSMATDIIHDIDSSIVVASPRKDYEPGTFNYERQVDWETHFLRKAGKTGVVAFWLANKIEETPGRAYAQTTRFELAEWKMKHEFEGSNLTIGLEDGFGNARYIQRRFEQDSPDVIIAYSLESMCKNAVDLLQKRD